MYRKIFDAPTGDLTETDIESLIERPVSEGPHLDYKREFNLKKKEDRKEIAKDAAAFANAYGGYLIYGMEEEGGFPKKLVGVEIEDPDRAASALEHAIRDLTEPAVEAHAQPIRLKDGRYAIAVEVPRSLNAPHMADGRFYRRAGRRSERMNYMDIRRAFAEKGDVIRKIRKRFEQRVEDLQKGYGPVGWSDSWSGAFLYVASIPAFEATHTYLLGPDARRAVGSLRMFIKSQSTRFCSEGLVANPGGSYREKNDFALITYQGELLHGAGPLEAHWYCDSEGEIPRCIEAKDLQSSVISLLGANLPHLVTLGFEPPYYLAFALVRARSHVIRAKERPEYGIPPTAQPIRHPFLLFDQLLLEEDARVVSQPLPQYDRASQERIWRERAARLQPILDRLYQAAGTEYSRIAHALDGAGST